MKQKKLIVTFLACFFISLMLFLTVVASVNGKVFCKKWTGYTQGVWDITLTNDETGEILGEWSKVPADGKCCVPVPDNTHVEITWTDWRGTHSELVIVGSGPTEKTNCIPPPPIFA